MANIKSAKKRILVNQAKALRNQMIKSQLKTTVKKFNAAVDAGDKAVASELLKVVVKSRNTDFIDCNLCNLVKKAKERIAERVDFCSCKCKAWHKN